MRTATDSRSLLETMMIIRAFDERVDELYAEGLLHGTAHFYVGQEAVAVGALAELGDDDVITSTHRGHGHAIASGLDLKEMAAELLGRANGVCHGKGGSMHIADVDHGMLGANGIVAGSLGIACGAGWAFRRRGQDHVCICFFGDGGAQEGISHEAMLLASMWKLPVIFLCENNQYAMSLSADKAFGSDFEARAAAYGMPGESVDGMEVEAVQAAVKTAVEHARAGEGPSLIEAKTYRYLGHSKSDANAYRTREEIDEWREQDPIQRWAALLEERGDLEADEWRTVDEEARKQVNEALDWAREQDEPAPDSAWEDVYA